MTPLIQAVPSVRKSMRERTVVVEGWSYTKGQIEHRLKSISEEKALFDKALQEITTPVVTNGMRLRNKFDDKQEGVLIMGQVQRVYRDNFGRVHQADKPFMTGDYTVVVLNIDGAGSTYITPAALFSSWEPVE